MTTKNGILLLLIVVFVNVYTQSVLVMAHGPRFAHNWNAHKRFRGGRVKRPEYYGSGCPPSSLMLVNSSDDTSFAMSVMFAEFQAQTSATTLRDKKKCFVNVELTVEPGMSIGIVHIDFRGYVNVPEANPDSFAQLSASYKMGREARGMIAERNFSSGYMDDLYESMDFDPVVWTPCKNRASQRDASSEDSTYWIRIESKIVAQKARLEDEDVHIGIDSSDATLEKRQLQYQMISRPCM